MKIYFDVCCLNRPFDDQSDYKIHLESEAILILISLCENDFHDIINSSIIEYEINLALEENKKKMVKTILSLSKYKIELNDKIIKRALYFEENGIDPFDALHLACAEYGSDILLTVDDKFIKKATKINDLKVEILNPLVWIKEVLR